jgi:uncharacterized repeat protein (TIGR01451 family)
MTVFNKRMPGKPMPVEAGARLADRKYKRGVLLAAFILACNRPEAARLGLDPVMGDGAAGRRVTFSGAGFLPGTAYTVLVGGVAPSPALVTANGSGAILPVAVLAMPFLPAGANDVVLTGGGKVLTFTGAYRVFRNICLSPAQGDGRAGITWTAGNLNGAWTGMVFRIEGTGFAASGSVGQNTIQVGGSATTHPAIAITANGRLPCTTVIIGSNLPLGYKDLVIGDGTVTETFTGVYAVRRSIGMNPARGDRRAGTLVAIQGWGFVGGSVIAANSVQLGAVTTTHGLVTVAADGTFTANVSLDAKADGVRQVTIPGHENFPNSFHGVQQNTLLVAMGPVVLDGVPNQAFQIQGTGNWWVAGTIAAGTITVQNAAGNQFATRHDPIVVPGTDNFPPTWVAVAVPVPRTVDRVVVPIPGGGTLPSQALFTKSTTGMCPVLTNGAAGFTVTISGFALSPAAAITAITVGGSAAAYPAATTGAGGNFGPTVLSLPALPYGDQDVVVTTGAASLYTALLHTRRSIGLSYVVGPGSTGDSVSINGTGFNGGVTLGANTVLFGVAPVNPAAIPVGATGTFAPAALTLPAMDAGAYDVTAQEVFTQPYRVYNPLVEISKYRDLATALPGETVSYYFSFTNTGIVGDPGATSLVISDVIPSGLQYAGVSGYSPSAVIEWYHSGSSSWTKVETPADITQIRWTLSASLPSGASGYAGFKATVQ